MMKSNPGKYLPWTFVFIAVLASGFAAQQPRGRQTGQPSPINNLKITYKMTTAGQSSESTTMIRGSRERSEMKLGYGMDVVSITQCDLKRSVQISDKNRKYVVTPMEMDEANTGAANRNVGSSPTTRGGLVTYVTTATDTGERRDMFGFNARHVKSTMTIESSPDACHPMKQRIETDGWYIDFSFGLNCDLGRAHMTGGPAAQGGCRDRIQFKNVGTGRKGYPLVETTTMYGPDGQVMFTSTKEVVELSREPLDAALFDVPAGYIETKNPQELYGMPSMGEMMNAPTQSQRPAQVQSNVSNSAEEKASGHLRVGVVQINNRSGRDVLTESLRDRLIGEIQSANVEAVPLNALSQAEAELEARAKQCDFILYTDLAGLKASKLGGMFGRVAGVSGAGKTEAKVEFKLFAVGETSPRLQSTATAKEEGDEASAGSAIAQEARVVAAHVASRGGR